MPTLHCEGKHDGIGVPSIAEPPNRTVRREVQAAWRNPLFTASIVTSKAKRRRIGSGFRVGVSGGGSIARYDREILLLG